MNLPPYLYYMLDSQSAAAAAAAVASATTSLNPSVVRNITNSPKPPPLPPPIAEAAICSLHAINSAELFDSGNTATTAIATQKETETASILAASSAAAATLASENGLQSCSQAHFTRPLAQSLATRLPSDIFSPAYPVSVGSHKDLIQDTIQAPEEDLTLTSTTKPRSQYFYSYPPLQLQGNLQENHHQQQLQQQLLRDLHELQQQQIQQEQEQQRQFPNETTTLTPIPTPTLTPTPTPIPIPISTAMVAAPTQPMHLPSTLVLHAAATQSQSTIQRHPDISVPASKPDSYGTSVIAAVAIAAAAAAVVAILDIGGAGPGTSTSKNTATNQTGHSPFSFSHEYATFTLQNMITNAMAAAASAQNDTIQTNFLRPILNVGNAAAKTTTTTAATELPPHPDSTGGFQKILAPVLPMGTKKQNPHHHHRGLTNHQANSSASALELLSGPSEAAAAASSSSSFPLLSTPVPCSLRTIVVKVGKKGENKCSLDFAQLSPGLQSTRIRASEINEAADQRRKREAERQRQRRAQLTQNQRDLTRRANAERQRYRRCGMTLDERRMENENAAQRKRQQRALESETQRMFRQESDRLRRKLRREKRARFNWLLGGGKNQRERWKENANEGPVQQENEHQHQYEDEHEHECECGRA